MDALELLHGRNSAVKLCEPAPDPESLNKIFQAAVRAPDHARLSPWRFVVIEGGAREKLGELYVEAALQKNLELPQEKIDKLRRNPLRAPMLIAVVVQIQEHPKVPEIEQFLSAGAAAQNILLACHALGYGAIWRTGDVSFLPETAAGLGLDPDNEKLIGFIYVGTVDGVPKPVPRHDVNSFVSYWQK